MNGPPVVAIEANGPDGALSVLWRLARRLWVPPQDCRLCGVRCGRTMLCPACFDALPHATAHVCPLCALPSPAGAVCGACRRQPPPLDAVHAALDYRWPVDGLVHSFKYRGELGLAPLFGALVAQRVGQSPMPDALVPVPISRRRLRERGFNQSVEIARQLARRLGLPLLAGAAGRSGNGPAQATLPWAQRAANVAGTFHCRLDTACRHVALVDDVMTSGATVHELARALRAAGATRVVGWILARTPAAHGAAVASTASASASAGLVPASTVRSPDPSGAARTLLHAGRQPVPPCST